MNKQLYTGDHALKNFLRPDVSVYTPLVELPASLNPYREKYDIHIYVKLLNMLPLANVKSLPAWNMLAGAQRAPGDITIVESSSGNTVFSLGILAKQFGVKKVKAIASRDVSQGKLDLLRIAGIDVQLIDGPLCPSPRDPKSSITIAKQLGQQPGWYNPGQYDNLLNPQAHTDYTGPQIYEQLEGNIALLAAGLGTTGTLVGTTSYLKSKIPTIDVVGVVRSPNNIVPGVRTRNGLDEVDFDWKDSLTDDLVTVNEHDSFERSLAMIRHGLLIGPSTGFAYAGVLKYLDDLHAKGTIDKLSGANIVFIAPDSMFPYASEYFEILDDSHFGQIEDQTSGRTHQEASHKIADVAELTTEDIFTDYIDDKGTLTPQHYRLIDIRDSIEYMDHHLPGSDSVPYETLDAWLDTTPQDKPLVFICRRGSTSLRAAQLATSKGIEAYSMIGGTAEWSDKQYPRIKAAFC